MAYRGGLHPEVRDTLVRLPSLKLTASYSMLCDVQDRLGSQGGPFEQRLSSTTDVSYFPIDDINQADDSAEMRAQAESLDDQQTADMALPFIGYTFKRFKGMNEV